MRRGWSVPLNPLWTAAHAVLGALLLPILIDLLYFCGPFGAAAVGLALGGTQLAFLRHAAGRDSALPRWWLVTTALAAIVLFYIALYGQGAFEARFFPYPAAPGIGASRAADRAYVAASFHRVALFACVQGLICGTLVGGMQVLAPLLSMRLSRRQLAWLWWIPVTALGGVLLGATNVDWPETLGVTSPGEYAFSHSAAYDVLAHLLPGMLYGILTGLILARIFRREIAQPAEPDP
jgi:hypothetical protein